jgi:hypothetical protein
MNARMALAAEAHEIKETRAAAVLHLDDVMPHDDAPAVFATETLERGGR